MKNFKLLWSFMKGNRLLYLASIISIGFATVFSFMSPLIIRYTIDSVIGGTAMDAPSWVMNIIETVGGQDTLRQNIWMCSIALVLLAIINGIFTYYKGKWSAVASESIAQNMKDALYDRLQNVSYGYYVKAETGDLIQRCTSDVDTVRRFLAMQFVEVGRAIFMLAMAIGIMFSLDVRMTFIAMSVIPAIFLFSTLYYMKIKESFLECDESEGKLTSILQENLTGVRVVRAFARQPYERDKFDEINWDFRNKVSHLIELLAWYWSFSDLLSMLQMGILLVSGVYWTVSGHMTLGTLVVFTTYEGMLLWPVRQMGRILTDMGKTAVAIGRIKEILDEPLDKDGEEGLKPEIQGNLEFSHVHFQYEDGKEVLRDISFSVNKGQTIAILGPTGSGKSSLMHLLHRLYDYDSGSIKIDGVELRDIDKKWIREKIGIVLQEPFLYSKTIKENLKMAQEEEDEERIYQSARIAYVHDVITGFDKGYDTLVGERGVTLSGGQKQRVAIARALIKDCPIMIFDDSLSAVDTETDAAIRKALRERRKDVTTFIISHRINTLSEADVILVMEDGRITEMGDHEALVAKPGLYRRIWELQNSKEDTLTA
ncbi:ABC transporter ATP-binding protein [Lutispora sp.]|uniref:ABC transporter ATP-binding protein n=1 Tax=Lutispora sp. TaxID=2828727 RepID=UPI002B21A4F5|nr:ABC transporter ATP-binding protein [Lutispora sp.]MEA4962598.1 ABC transporter ATP-binding protein [Lutispora sp.]